LEYRPPGQPELVLELPQHVGGRGACGHREVREQEREHHPAEPDEEPAVQAEARGEDLGEPDLPEPEPVRVEGDRRPGHAEDDEGGEEPEADARAPRGAYRAGDATRHACLGEAMPLAPRELAGDESAARRPAARADMTSAQVPWVQDER